MPAASGPGDDRPPPFPPRQAALQVAECLLPGLTAAAAGTLAQRVRAELARSPSRRVAYLGALLMAEDEVLLCLFAGPAAEVRAVSERAGLPFERIVACHGLGWQAPGRKDHQEEDPWIAESS